MVRAIGTYPFGSALRSVEQRDRRQKKVFVLGVYASAVHARWLDPRGRELVRALAVASEPEIFWDGSNAADIVRGIEIPSGAGKLEAADMRLNGPSGRSLDQDYLGPLGVTRADAWLCDLVPHTCVNDAQRSALAREYEPRRVALGLPAVDLPDVPQRFTNAERRQEILQEIQAAQPSVIILLGDQPIRHFLVHYDKRWSTLSDFSDTDEGYGGRWTAQIADGQYEILPLAHPRQAQALGRHSEVWRRRHEAWKPRASSLLSEL
jgi:uracil-DNA glycosylase